MSTNISDALKGILTVESNGGKSYGNDSRCPPGCNYDVNSCSCGPYQIKEPYFKDCSEGKSNLTSNDWVTCSTDKACAEQCTVNYLERYTPGCTGKDLPSISVKEFARVHNGGPEGCQKPSTISYGEKVEKASKK